MSHPETDMVSFTGSTRAGRRVSELAAQAVKPASSSSAASRPTSSSTTPTSSRRSPTAWPSATSTRVRPAARSRGCWCRATSSSRSSRSLRWWQSVHSRRPLHRGHDARPARLRHARARARLHREGAGRGSQLVTGGDEPPEGLDSGYFVRPTIFSDVTSDMTIAQEEIFDPLAIMPYEDEDDAVRIANDSIYGLAGGSGRGRGTRQAGGHPHPHGAGRSTAAPSTRSRRSAATSSRTRPRDGPLRPRGVPRGQVAPARPARSLAEKAASSRTAHNRRSLGLSVVRGRPVGVAGRWASQPTF